MSSAFRFIDPSTASASTSSSCAIEIVDGEVGPKNKREQWRLDFPPHDADDGLRLACQIDVHHDLVIRKHPGFWGQDVDDASSSPF